MRAEKTDVNPHLRDLNLSRGSIKGEVIVVLPGGIAGHGFEPWIYGL